MNLFTIFEFNPDPASIRMCIAQPLDPYSDIKNLGNHNKDSARFFLSSTNQYVALCTHEYLQDLGLSYLHSDMWERSCQNK